MEFIKKKRANETEPDIPDVRVRINVGGTHFDTWRTTLERIPGTRLALLSVLGESDDAWDREQKEFFFDRHPGVFESVIQYYRTEELHTDQNLCGNIIQGELEFWGLTELDIEPCCWGQYSKFKDHRETLAALDDNFTQQNDIEPWSDKTTNLQKFRHKVWQFVEEPSSSRGAKVFAVFSMFFVVLSIAVFCLETYYWFRVPIEGASAYNSSVMEHYTSATGDQCIKTIYKKGSYKFEDTEPHAAMTYLDYICAAYFTIEFLVRITFSPNKWQFIKSPLNVIDLLCLIPHLTAIILKTADPTGSSKDTSNLFRAFLALRTVRILRIFKLMKHYSAFKILVYTIKVSTKELLLLVVFLFTGVLIFASIIFYTENDTFDSIPVGFWWALVTMTTVGYGDKVPKTEGGYIIGCFCVLCGVLTVAFTVPIVVNNFTLYYSHAQSRIKLPVHKRKELKRKIFLKNQKSLEFLQKLKWKRDKNKSKFSDIDAIKSPRAPPCGQEANITNTSPKQPTTMSLYDAATLSSINNNKSPYPPDRKTDNASRAANNGGGPGGETPSGVPDRIQTVSESIDLTVADSMSVSLPGTPLDSGLSMNHKAETEQLLNEYADADKKLREERRRQLDMINQKREQRRQQITTAGGGGGGAGVGGEARKRPSYGGGNSKSETKA